MSHALTDVKIDEAVRLTSPGSFALGYLESGAFIASYATHPSCSAIPAPALGPVGVVRDSGYTHFEFSYAPSRKAAFDGECRAYHDFGGSYGSLDNEQHPAPPEGVPWMCSAPDHRHQ